MLSNDDADDDEEKEQICNALNNRMKCLVALYSIFYSLIEYLQMKINNNKLNNKEIYKII